MVNTFISTTQRISMKTHISLPVDTHQIISTAWMDNSDLKDVSKQPIVTI